MSFLAESAGRPPKIFGNKYALRCNLVHFETILRNVTVVFYLIFLGVIMFLFMWCP